MIYTALNRTNKAGRPDAFLNLPTKHRGIE